MIVHHLMSAHWALEAIRERRLKISRLEDMNDPFELLGVDLSVREERQAWNRTRKTLAKTKGVLCFSRNWENPVLWSHYGDRHRGICLSFAVSDDKLSPVRYEAKRLQSQFLARRAAGTLDEVFMNLILTTKFEDWRYEDEVRAFCQLDEIEEQSGHYFADFGGNLRLTQVILGARCSVKTAELRPLFRTHPNRVLILKARLAFQSYRVVRQKKIAVARVGLTTGSRGATRSGAD